MNMNPYAPPQPPSALAAQAPVSRTPFVLAAAGAWLASAYWALLTLLIARGASVGAGSGFNAILPLVLIALYASRGYQLYKGDPRAVKRILWLHGIGMIASILQVVSGAGVVFVTLQAIKIVIHLFGGIAAIFAQRAITRGLLPAA